MTQIRSILTAACFTVLSVIAIASAVGAISLGLPETLATNASVLIAALTEEDVSREPRPAKLKLGQRVQRELHENVDWAGELGELNEQQRERLVDNIAELAKESIDLRVEEYSRLPERGRNRFLDRQIEEIRRWAMIVDRAARTEGEPLVGIAAMGELINRMSKWYSDITPEKRAQLEKFQQALQARVMEDFKRRMRFNAG